MLKIYHNPRCRKSREALQFLEAQGKTPQIVLYLEEPFTKKALTALLKKLKLNASELVRTTEPIWKEQFKGKNLSEDQLLEALVEHPKLIERPIVETSTKAAIGRPLTNVEAIL